MLHIPTGELVKTIGLPPMYDHELRPQAVCRISVHSWYVFLNLEFIRFLPRRSTGSSLWWCIREFSRFLLFLMTWSYSLQVLGSVRWSCPFNRRCLWIRSNCSDYQVAKRIITRGLHFRTPTPYWSQCRCGRTETVGESRGDLSVLG